MKVLLMQKDGIIHKVSALDKIKVQEKKDAGFEVVGSENLEPSTDITEAVKAAIEALDIDAKIAEAVAEAVKSLQTPVKTPTQAPANKK